MQLLIHFLGGENSLIVHLEFKVITSKLKNLIEKNQTAMALQSLKTLTN
jgi:hypothetical protein